MKPLPPEEVGCFCDDTTAELIISFLNHSLCAEEKTQLKIALIEYLEWSGNDRGFDEDFVKRFIDSLFSESPIEEFKEFFYETCSDGFGLVNSKLFGIFCSNVECFKSYCYNLSLPFLETFFSAVESTGLKPKQFAKNNGIKFDILEEIYSAWYFQDREEHWITGGSELVKLCDFFGIKVKHIDKSPAEWNIDEQDFACLAQEATKEDCKNFARLFSKKPESWFDGSQWILQFKE